MNIGDILRGITGRDPIARIDDSSRHWRRHPFMATEKDPSTAPKSGARLRRYREDQARRSRRAKRDLVRSSRQSRG